MKIDKLMSFDKDGAIVETIDVRFLVHKSLINKNVKKMIMYYMDIADLPKKISTFRHEFDGKEIVVFAPGELGLDLRRVTTDENNFLWIII